MAPVSHPRYDMRMTDRLKKTALKAALDQTEGFALDTDIYHVAASLYTGIGTSVSLQCLSLLKNKDWVGLANMTVSHTNYTDTSAFYADYCAVSFLKKFGDFPIAKVEGVDPRTKATLDSWYQSEAQCKATNERFIEFTTNGAFAPTPQVTSILLEAKRVILAALGSSVPRAKHWDIRFGPGAVSNAFGDRTTIADKISAYPECTPDAVAIVSRLRHCSPTWYNLLAAVHPGCTHGVRKVVDDFGNEVILEGRIAPRCIRGNRFAMVPKKATIHRGIGIEPGTNMVFQLAFGSMLNKALRRLGICKDIQPTVNKNMACHASLYGTYATVDLASASDTISYELVKFLLPSPWFECLTALRSPETFIEGIWVELEKFSSMGNGFTFELETLIFYALTRASCTVLGVDSEVHVFGDDIIVRGEVLSVLTEVFTFCGFSLNPEKTFHNVGFNESCGGDFLHGVGVRPYFCKEVPQHAIEWFGLVNGIRRMGNIHSGGNNMSPIFLSAWLRAFERVPRLLRFQGPVATHDCWIHTEYDEYWNTRVRAGITSCRGLKVVPVKRPLERYGNLVQMTSLLLAPVSDGLPLRGQLRRLATLDLSTS